VIDWRTLFERHDLHVGGLRDAADFSLCAVRARRHGDDEDGLLRGSLALATRPRRQPAGLLVDGVQGPITSTGLPGG
jgi:hypothetical protein